MKCQELAALFFELDELERQAARLERLTEPSVEAEIVRIIRAIQAHRKFHSACDFNDPPQ